MPEGPQRAASLVVVLGAGSRTRSFAECYCSHRAHATRRDRRDGYPPHLILHVSRNRPTAVTANITLPRARLKARTATCLAVR